MSGEAGEQVELGGKDIEDGHDNELMNGIIHMRQRNGRGSMEPSIILAPGHPAGSSGL